MLRQAHRRKRAPAAARGRELGLVVHRRGLARHPVSRCAADVEEAGFVPLDLDRRLRRTSADCGLHRQDAELRLQPVVVLAGVSGVGMELPQIGVFRCISGSRSWRMRLSAWLFGATATSVISCRSFSGLAVSAACRRSRGTPRLPSGGRWHRRRRAIGANRSRSLGRAHHDLLLGVSELLGEDAAYDAVDLDRAVAGFQRLGHPGEEHAQLLQRVIDVALAQPVEELPEVFAAT
jgi:hypothetical protein